MIGLIFTRPDRPRYTFKILKIFYIYLMRFFCLIATMLLSSCVTIDTQTVTAGTKDKADARIALGLSYLQRDNRVKARENIQKALEHAPEYYRAQLAMAHYLEQVSEFTHAEHWFQQAISQHPNNGQLLNDYGSFLCKQSRFQEANVLFERAVIQPNYYYVADSYENAAFCALKAGQQARAARYFERAIAHDSNRPQAILNLAHLEMNQGRYEAAQHHITLFNQQFGIQEISLRLMVELETRKHHRSSPKP
ncbi:type IV pilus biogenesis/stability protein PilW [Vibrio coralliilyticus]|uniref:Type IV pilus biogenesis/stability protein PilW n=2 Tax=Vibrio coralliilyticus TaxID=190893 RepID=A0AAP6ZTB1_9VIBR|nr:type IV pilus biogenesis/stability protein PilW [Vibrio coralliilyticus]